MAAPRNKNQARRKGGSNGTPGWVWLLAGLVLGALVFMATAKGAEAREFLSESRFELRKVVWPTRQETTRTMWVVIAVVILMSLMLAGMDLVIQAAVKWLLGNG